MSYDQNFRRGYGQRDVQMNDQHRQNQGYDRQPPRRNQPPPGVIDMLEMILDDLAEIKQALRRLEHQQTQPLLQLPPFDSRTNFPSVTPQRSNPDLIFDQPRPTVNQ